MNYQCPTHGSPLNTGGQCPQCSYVGGGLATGAESPPDKVLEFAKRVIEVALDGNEVDGGDVQEWAVEAGLLIPTEMAAPCRAEGCQCEEYGDFPQTCYRYSPELRVDRVGGGAEPSKEQR